MACNLFVTEGGRAVDFQKDISGVEMNYLCILTVDLANNFVIKRYLTHSFCPMPKW